ncbi:MAG: replication protein [Sporolactobacillus sp.]
MEKKKEQRSNKWAFLLYKDSAPENYLEVLEHMHVPFILSPWHDKDVNSETGELKKSHKHGALFFDSLKSYSQVSGLISEKLNAPSHVETVMSPKGMYDYFTHAENPNKMSYRIEDIESGCGFELEKFVIEQDEEAFMNEVIDIIEVNNFTEFEDLVKYARANNYLLLSLIVDRTYFFVKLLDSRRYNPANHFKKALNNQGSKTSNNTSDATKNSDGNQSPQK